MSRAARAAGAFLLAAGAACSDPSGQVPVPVPGLDGDGDGDGWWKSSASVRLERRAYDGAPPIIPHGPFGATCRSCHNRTGQAVPEHGYAPPAPHDLSAGMQFSRCQQCHVFQLTEGRFRGNDFQGIKRKEKPALRAHVLAPPIIPHPVFMREDCLACHSGPAARESSRTTHPERDRCRQCHLRQITAATFQRPAVR